MNTNLYTIINTENASYLLQPYYAVLCCMYEIQNEMKKI